MDAPAAQNFEEVQELAQDRTACRRLVDEKFGPSTRRKRKNKRSKRRPKSIKPLQQLQITRPPPPIIKTTITAERAGNMIQSTLPTAWQPVPNGTTSNKPSKLKSRTPPLKEQSSSVARKPARLTNAQRAAWAHAHYIIHHGTNSDAVKFMTHQKNVENTPAEALYKIRVMARRTVPTWEQAAAVLFSSSDSSSDESSGFSSRAPTLPQPTSQPTSPMMTSISTTTAKDTGPEPSPKAERPSLIASAKGRLNASNKSVKVRKPMIKSKSATPTTPPPTTSTARSKLAPGTTTRRYITRSMATKTRRPAEATRTAAVKKCKTPRRRGAPKPSTRPKKILIAPSQIRGAGMGLYLKEGAKAGDWIARYSGDVMTKEECARRKRSKYRMQIHKNLFLDAADPKHFEGRFINDARGSKFKVNARFAAGFVLNKCSTTGHFWVRIYATKTIKPGDEVFADYGEDFWAEAQLEALSDPAILKSVTTLTSSSLWAAPAPIPDVSDESHHSRPADTDNNKATTTPATTMIWPTQVPPPSSPTILGHFTSSQHPDHNTHRPICFPQPLSPVIIGPSPNHNHYMKEEFSFNQMYNLDDTLLLPNNITHPPTHVNVLNPQTILL